MKTSQELLEKAVKSVEEAMKAIADAKCNIAESHLRSDGDVYFERRDKIVNMKGRLDNLFTALAKSRADILKL